MCNDLCKGAPHQLHISQTRLRSIKMFSHCPESSGDLVVFLVADCLKRSG